MKADQLWIMVDIETSGPVIGRHSMTELGAAVGSVGGGVVDRFEAVIAPIGEAVETSRQSFARAKREGVAPAEAMRRFAEWCRPYLAKKALFVARPAAFDWPWIVWYAWTYLGRNPFGFKAVCASSWFQARGLRFDVELPHVAAKDAEIQLAHFLGLGDTLATGIGGVACLAFSPDGRRVAAGSWDETVRMWDVTSRREERKFDGHGRSVYCVAFSPDGRLVASGDGEDDEKPGTLLVWEAATGKIVQRIGPFAWSVAGVAWSPDGTCVASACYDEILHVHDVRTGEELLSIRAEQDELNTVAWSPDGALLASGGGHWDEPQAVKLWDAATGKLVHALEGHGGEVTAVAFALDGRLASASAESVRVWDASVGRELVAIRGDGLRGLAFDGARVACGSGPRVRIWDAATGRELHVLEGHREDVNCVAMSGALVASGAGHVWGSGELRLVWDLEERSHGGS